MVMAMCNMVIPIQSKSGEILYKAQSQDEEALVQGAARLNMVLVQNNANMLELRFNSSTLHYELLDILEFTSDRKKMSVVLRDCKNGKIILLSKGANEAILPYATTGQQIRVFTEAVEQYAQLGLRTLCLAWRELEKDEYQEWAFLFKEANSSLVDREWRIAEVCQKIEHDFQILGVTAIEDRLQMQGSIPLFWSQEASRFSPKPDIILQRYDPTYEATKKHFEDLAERYGNPIIVLNLIKALLKLVSECSSLALNPTRKDALNQSPLKIVLFALAKMCAHSPCRQVLRSSDLFVAIYRLKQSLDSTISNYAAIICDKMGA